MTAVEWLIRACPQCGSEAFRALPGYSSPPWQTVECPSCTFVYLRNPPAYKHLVSDFAWEKTRVAEVERRKARSACSRRDACSMSAAALARRCLNPSFPSGVEISEALSREADDHMRARGGRAIHAPAVDGVKEFPDRYFTSILLRSFLEHEKQPKELLEQCSRVLAPDGAIYVRVPNYGSLNRRMLGAKWCGFRYPDHVNYFTTTSLGAMAGDCGLKLKLLNPIRLPLDDNINAVLSSEAASG
jgi:SAM-dependent methyltransferase